MFQSLGSPNSNKMDSPAIKRCGTGNWGLAGKHSFGNKTNVVTNIFNREVNGTPLQKLKNPFGDNGTPARLRMPIEDIIPPSALEAGNIFMGFSNCGRYLLSYTCRPGENFGSVFDTDGSYMYFLHIWLFSPYRRARKVSQVCLFDNNGVYDNNLLIEISQWDMDDSHILITGHSANPDTECHHTFYTTITTIPDAKNCPNCVYMQDDELEDDGSANQRTRTNCILHGLTLHMKYDHVAPYPKLNADVQLRFKDSVLLNTGNVIHMVSFKLIRPTPVKTDMIILPATYVAQNTIKVPLRCDIWLKLTNANMAALANMKFNAQESRNAMEKNIVSLNGLDYLLSLFPHSTSSKLTAQPQIKADVYDRANRRLSQSSNESEFSMFSPKSTSGCDFGPMSPPFLNKPRSPRRNETSNNAQNQGPLESPTKLMLPPQERKFFKRRLSSQSLQSTGLAKDMDSPTKSVDESAQTDCTETPSNQSAFDVFEMRFEDTAVERHLSSFKTFRKRRLADKKYEFNDADLSAENIIPLKMTRRKPKYSQLQGNTMSFSNPRSPRNANENNATGSDNPRGSYLDGSHPKSPRTHLMSPVMSPTYINESPAPDVLRPLNNNPKVKVPTLSPNSNIGMVDINDMSKVKDEDINKDFSSHLLSQGQKKMEAMDVPAHPHSKPTISVNVNCVAKVTRSYIQKEDDNMSVITDIEDDLCQGYPFPVALPLEVHGAGYQQLQMISNSKAEKFQVPVVQVLQRTLDIEMLCNEVASLICLASDKHYCSCIDFDLIFADANPDCGTISAVVVMLLQATALKPRNRGEKLSIPCVRRKYEALFSFEWIPSHEHCRILYKSNLKELDTIPDPWHPTECMESIIKMHLSSLSSSKNSLSNALAVHDWQSLDELVDASGIVTLYKDEGPSQKTETRQSDFNSLMFVSNFDLASVASTTTDTDDEWGM